MSSKNKNSVKKTNQSSQSNLLNNIADNNQHLQQELDKLTQTFADLKQQHNVLENNLSLEVQKVENLNQTLNSEQQKLAEGETTDLPLWDSLA